MGKLHGRGIDWQALAGRMDTRYVVRHRISTTTNVHKISIAIGAKRGSCTPRERSLRRPAVIAFIGTILFVSFRRSIAFRPIQSEPSRFVFTGLVSVIGEYAAGFWRSGRWSLSVPCLFLETAPGISNELRLSQPSLYLTRVRVRRFIRGKVMSHFRLREV
jgi:hypothetical protein